LNFTVQIKHSYF